VNDLDTPPQTFAPPPRWARLYGLGALLALAVFGWTAWQAWLARGQSDFALWLAAAAVSAFLLPWLAFGWWWLRRVRYTLTPQALHLAGPGAQATVPLESIVWAGVQQHYDRPLPSPPRGWPGLQVGLAAPAQGPTVAFYAVSRSRWVVVEDAEGRVFVLTPARPAAFLTALAARLEAHGPATAEAQAAALEEPASAPAAATALATTAPAAPEPSAASPGDAEDASPGPAPATVPPETRAAAPDRRAALGMWGLVLGAWLATLLTVAAAWQGWPLLGAGLQYALYGHLVLEGAETGLGFVLAGRGQKGPAYALWAAGLLSGLGFLWAVASHLWL